VAHCHLQWADAVLLGAVEIGVQPMTRLLRSGDKGVVQFVARAQVGDAERSARAMMLVSASFLVLGAPEIRQHVLIRPAGIAHLAPQVEILLLAADVDEPVDGTRSAKHLAARPQHSAAAELRERLGLEHPSDLRVEDVSVEPGGDVDPRVAVLAAGLEQQHAARAVSRQAVRQHTAGRAGADNDKVEFSDVLHSARGAFSDQR